MTTPNIEEMLPQSMLGFRLKGSSIFYSCTVLSVNEDKIVVSIPISQTKPIEISTRVELRWPISFLETVLFGGVVTSILTDSLEIRITSRQNHIEKRKHIRITTETRIKYMEEKVREEVWHTTYTINISPGGSRFYSSRFHQEGDVLIFQFNIPEGFSSRLILVRGRVINAKRVTDYASQYNSQNQGYKRYVIQVSFQGLSPKDYIDILRYIYTTSKKR